MAILQQRKGDSLLKLKRYSHPTFEVGNPSKEEVELLKQWARRAWNEGRVTHVGYIHYNSMPRYFPTFVEITKLDPEIQTAVYDTLNYWIRSGRTPLVINVQVSRADYRGLDGIGLDRWFICTYGKGKEGQNETFLRYASCILGEHFPVEIMDATDWRERMNMHQNVLYSRRAYEVGMATPHLHEDGLIYVKRKQAIQAQA
jgi:hypothetical protein